jgi:4'-phosphopantetheinyl transferase
MIPDSRFLIPDCPGSPIRNQESGIWNLLCIIQTSAQVPANDRWLSEDEKKIAAGFRVQKRRADWRLGRWTAKRVICSYRAQEDIVLSSLEIRAAGDGAPEAFYNGKPAAVSISISHSRDRSFCAAGPLGMSIGCDLEWVEPREENFAADYFTPEEISFVVQAPVKREFAETLIWSAKEATLKILRKGLSRDTRSVLIHPDLSGPDDAWRRWTGRCLESERIFNGWWRAADGFIYTIASQ